MHELDNPAFIVVLVIALLLFGGKVLPSVARGLEETIRSFQHSLFGDEWRRRLLQPNLTNELRRRLLQSNQAYELPNGALIAFISILFAWLILGSLLKAEMVTGKQALALVGVLSVWLVVGYFCFSRRNRDE